MIKLHRPTDIASYYNFRCGDVLCVGPTSYNVCCALCGQRVPYDGFPQHFRQEHLMGRETATETETETEDCKLFNAQEAQEEQHLDAPVEVEEEVEPMTIKCENDPIAHDASNESNHHVHVDLAQIALLDQDQDQEYETDKDVDAIATRRRRRATVLKTENKAQWDENQLEWMTAEGSEVNEENSATDDNDEQEDNTRDMLFQCDQCERAYNTKRSLQSHKRSKHNDGKPRSKHMTPMDAAGSALDRHKKQRKGPAKIYKCAEIECNQTFRTERDLRGHRWKHTGIFCDICGKPFTQSGNMMRHRQRHSGIKPYKCQQTDCAATFYTQKELTSHNICHTGRMPCICEICGRPCRDRGVLTAHMRRHTGERPAKCEVCDKSFYSFHDLNVHAVSHTNLRPFVCDVCGSTFQRKKALRVHKLLHSEQRKYCCKLCNKSFAQSGGLNAHMRTHESARTKTKSKSTSLLTASTVVELTTPIQITIEHENENEIGNENENVSNEEMLQEAVTIELIQEEQASHVEVVDLASAGSWHVT
ncbi:zinc finger protein 92 [Drosophila innubila]|uniref:zinc finger protein 92 n=1 Tax=Drosophila innubila TaxID=198719 RepID=UPI00148DDDF3|nr:zinc finger protein 92 [Drosophila innubila]